MSGYARLIDYGTCNPVNESVGKASDSPTGYFLEADKLVFTERVDKVKIRRGLVFGISYQLDSRQDDFLSRIIHPLLVSSGTSKCYKETIEEKYVSSNGLHFDYYRLEHT